MKTISNRTKKDAARQEPHNNGESPPPKQNPDFEPPPRRATADDDEGFVYEEVDLENLDSITDDLDEDDGADKFPLDALEAFPSLLRPIQDWMRQLGMPSLLPVICALLVLSMALGRGLRARNNKGGTYPNLFALLGADSGTGKTLVFDTSVEPLIELQKELTEEFNQAASMLKADLLLVKKEIEAIAFLFSKLKKGGKNLTPEEEAKNKEWLAALHQEQEKIEDKLAKPPAIWTSDFTAEALASRLANSNELLSVASDEGGIAIQCLEGRYANGDDSDDMLLCKMFSVNSHVQDRIGRGRIMLAEPCGSLLLLVQPDILTRAFSNERLVIGGFLARCLCADTKLEMQYEDENAEVTAFDTETSASWSKLIKEIYRKYHNAAQPYDLRINPGVHRLSCRMHNWVVARVRGRLFDVRSFAARWREIAWKMSVVLHAALYGIESEHHPLEESTFEAASTIVRYFTVLQLEVLAEMRSGAVEKTHARLQELFLHRGQKPITVRDLTKNHKILREKIFACVKTHPETYRMMEKRSSHGGEPSSIVFLRQFPPAGVKT